MADQSIKFILEAVDNVSDTLKTVNDNMETTAKTFNDDFGKVSGAIQTAGLAAGAFLAVAVKGAADEETAINNAARATTLAGGSFDEAKSKISEFANAMENYGFSSEDATRAVTLLVTKAGRDLPTALAEADDLLAANKSRGGDLAKTIKELDGPTNKFEGSFDQLINTMSTGDKMAITFNKINNLVEKMGEKLLPIIEKILGVIDGLITAFENLDPGNQDLLVTFATVGAVIVAVAGFVAFLISTFGPLIPIIGAVVGVVGGLIGALGPIIAIVASIVTGIGPLLLIIAAVIAAILLLTTIWNENWFGIQDIVSNVVNFIINFLTLLVTTLITSGQQFIDETIRWTTSIFTTIITTITDLKTKWDTFWLDIALALVEQGKNLITTVGTFIQGIVDKFKALIEQGISFGKQLVDNVIKGIQGGIGAISNILGDIGKGVVESVTGKKKVPGFADGGYVSSPTLALVGEAGPEFIVPANKMNDIMSKGNGPVSIVVNNYEATNTDKITREFSQVIMRTLGASNSDAMVSSRGFS